MQIVALDHIQLAMPAGKEELARHFYNQVLGLPEVAKPLLLQDRGGCWFQGPGVGVHLGVEASFTPARKAHPAFVVEDLVEFQQRLEAAGVPIIPDDSLPNVRRFYASDPFGNRIEFSQQGDHFEVE